MHLLANENVPRLTIEALRAAGHDLLWARTDMGGSSDEEVMARAQAENRILITCDKDFGNLAFHAGLPATCGVILLRVGNLPPEAGVQRTIQAIGSRADWAGNLAVVDAHRIRIRPLPARS